MILELRVNKLTLIVKLGGWSQACSYTNRYDPEEKEIDDV